MNSFFRYLEFPQMPCSANTNDLELLVMHGLGAQIVIVLILISPQVNPSHVASNICNKNTFSILK